MGKIAILIAFAFALFACAAQTTVPSPSITQTVDGFATSRRAMVDEQIRVRGIVDAGVLRAMETVPRHECVPQEWIGQAYEDHPLPIGSGQTISQSYIVAVMAELAQVERGDRVLEIGTGSGYQAAVLVMLTDQVYSIEIIPSLAERAAARLKRLS